MAVKVKIQASPGEPFQIDTVTQVVAGNVGQEIDNRRIVVFQVNPVSQVAVDGVFCEVELGRGIGNVVDIESVASIAEDGIPCNVPVSADAVQLNTVKIRVRDHVVFDGTIVHPVSENPDAHATGTGRPVDVETSNHVIVSQGDRRTVEGSRDRR